jgi:hypothetical protein
MAALTKVMVPEIYTAGRAERSTVQSLDWSSLNLTRRITEAHALGLPVLPWTVNTKADMERQLDLGVDGIITDYPTRLRTLMEVRGMRSRSPTSSKASITTALPGNDPALTHRPQPVV